MFPAPDSVRRNGKFLGRVPYSLWGYYVMGGTVYLVATRTVQDHGDYFAFMAKVRAGRVKLETV